METNTTRSAVILQLVGYWLIVGIPLMWGIWKTLAKLPALFQ